MMRENKLGQLGNRDFCSLEGHASLSEGHDNKHGYVGAAILAQAVGPFPSLPWPGNQHCQMFHCTTPPEQPSQGRTSPKPPGVKTVEGLKTYSSLKALKKK